MEILTFNSVLRIDAPGLAGFYRVLVPEGPGGMHLLYRVAPLPSNEAGERLRVKAARRSAKKGRAFENSKRIWVSSEELRKLKDSGLCKVVEFEIDSGRGTIGREDIKPDGDKPGRQATKLRNTARERRRLEIMAEFMDGRILQEALASEQGLGALVSRAVATHKCARSKVYAWFELLCVFGFVGDALRLRYDRCGAKGQARVWGAKLKKPGRPGVRALSNPDRGPGSIAVAAELRQRIAASYLRHAGPAKGFEAVYDKLIEDVYVKKYKSTKDGMLPVLPPASQLPTKAAVRHVVNATIELLVRRRLQTTWRNVERNFVGARGRSFRGIAGPGLVFAIDATVGDIYLRSSINRAWIIGRPIVYFVVDIWSTAIVGFHVCLQGPSWATAQVALFSTLSGSSRLSEIWGISYKPYLDPEPGVPAKLLADRGELFCHRARDVALSLGYSCGFNPAYLPKLKGMVEVLHRIARDEYFGWTPGAFNSRRKELELRPDARDSVMTIRAYAESIARLIEFYNLTSNRRNRLTSEMIAAGVPATPAGLWSWGFAIGMGYAKSIPSDVLYSQLLPQGVLRVNRAGGFFQELEYSGPVFEREDWTTRAKQLGAFQRTINFFPNSAARIWMPSPGSNALEELRLTTEAKAPPTTTHEEWLDACAARQFEARELEYAALKARIEKTARHRNLVKRETELTREAELNAGRDRPTVSEARAMENTSSFTNPVAWSGPVIAAPADLYGEPGMSVYEQMFSESSSDDQEDQI